MASFISPTTTLKAYFTKFFLNAFYSNIYMALFNGSTRISQEIGLNFVLEDFFLSALTFFK